MKMMKSNIKKILLILPWVVLIVLIGIQAVLTFKGVITPTTINQAPTSLKKARTSVIADNSGYDLTNFIWIIPKSSGFTCEKEKHTFEREGEYMQYNPANFVQTDRHKIANFNPAPNIESGVYFSYQNQIASFEFVVNTEIVTFQAQFSPTAYESGTEVVLNYVFCWGGFDTPVNKNGVKYDDQAFLTSAIFSFSGDIEYIDYPLMNDFFQIVTYSELIKGVLNVYNSQLDIVGLSFLGSIFTNNKKNNTSLNYDGITISATNIYYNPITEAHQYQEGYNQGEAFGKVQGITQGQKNVTQNPNDFNLYTNEQYHLYGDEKYQIGLKDGAESNITMSWVSSLFGTLTDFFQIELLPNIKIIYLFGTIIIFGFVRVIIRWFK